MKNKFYLSAKILFFILFLVSISHHSHSPITNHRTVAAESSASNIVIGKLPLSEDQSLIFLGVECHSRMSACDNWDELGLEHIKGNTQFATPKFLILKNRSEIEQVFTFEYGLTANRKISKAIEGNGELLLHYVKLPKKIKARLPRVLVDPLLVKRQRTFHSLLTYVNLILQFTPLSPYSRTIVETVKFTEEKKFFQAAYLNRLIEMAIIDETLPELLTVFDRNILNDLGSSLRIRYRGSSQDMVTSTGATKRFRADFYEEFIQYRTEIQSINMSKLVTRANEEGLVLVPYSRDMAILFYDPASEINKELYRDLLLNTSLVKNEDRYKAVFESEKKIIPLGVFLLSDKERPTKTIDFERPNIILKKEQVVKTIDYALSIGMSFVDNIYIGTAVKVGQFVGKLILKKKGKIFFSSVLESEANLKALLDSGMVKIDSTEVSKDIFSFYLDEMDLEDEKVAYFEELLNSGDKIKIDQGVKEIILLYQSSQTTRRLSHGMNESFKVNNRVVGWLSLKKWISDTKSREEIFSYLKSRDILRDKQEQKEIKRELKRQSQRKPSSQNSEAAIVFMIDGLRPDRIREAYKKGLVPNLGKYFIDDGVEFKSFAPRSLTLPSWSSILTGVDQDHHGLKSNGPMSRLLGKPTENYIDPRKDLLNIAFNSKKNNRAYDHLKESGRMWLPDYFNDGEVHTNYMPVNNAPFYKLGSLFKTILKDTRKLLFGNFSGSIALDRVSAIETVQHIQKNPGKTKLILNWLTCVDVFSHHNNKALDVCYKELDKSFKLIVDQMKNDPLMKNAHMFIISDHGHIGGNESEHSHFKLKEEGSYYNNTALNLTTLLAGDYRDYPNFNFNPFVFESPYPNNDLKFLSEFQIHPFKYQYKGSKRKKELKGKKAKAPSVLIDYSGDSMAQIYFKHPTKEWNQKLTYHELTQLNKRNIFDDLFSVKLRNTVNPDTQIKKILNDINQGHPVWMISHALSECKHQDFEKILGEKIPAMARTPILLRGKDSDYGLVLTQEKNEQLFYQYYLLSSFSQDQDRKCLGTLSSSPKDVLIDYYSKIKNQWLTKEELLNIFSNHDYPTALISLVGTLTLTPELAGHAKRQQEIPDIVLYSHKGFNFNSALTTESDHGGLTHQETRNSFFYSQLGHQFGEAEQEFVFKKPALNYYLTPFILELTEKSVEDKYLKQVPSFHDYFKVRPKRNELHRATK